MTNKISCGHSLTGFFFFFENGSKWFFSSEKNTETFSIKFSSRTLQTHKWPHGESSCLSVERMTEILVLPKGSKLR